MRIIKKSIYHLLTILWLIIILIPLITIVIGSFKPASEFYSTAAYELPKSLNFENYYSALNGSGLINSLIATTILIILSIVVTTVLSSLVAFVLERFDFKFKKVITGLFIVVSFFPMAVMQVSVFRVMNITHLFNTYFGLALIYSVSDIVVIYLFRDYIRKMSTSIDNSARIAGASYWQIYLHIILPSLKPAIMIVSMYKVITIYNDFYMQSLYLISHKTVSTYLYQFTSPYKMLWPEISATIVILIIPAIIMLILIQSKNKKILFERGKND